MVQECVQWTLGPGSSLSETKLLCSNCPESIMFWARQRKGMSTGWNASSLYLWTCYRPWRTRLVFMSLRIHSQTIMIPPPQGCTYGTHPGVDRSPIRRYPQILQYARNRLSVTSLPSMYGHKAVDAENLTLRKRLQRCKQLWKFASSCPLDGMRPVIPLLVLSVQSGCFIASVLMVWPFQAAIIAFQ